MNVLILNDTSTNPNQGCQVTMFLFDKCIRRLFPGATPSAVTLERLLRIPRYITLDLERNVALLRSDRRSRDVTGSIAAADLVIVNGEGTLLESPETGILNRDALHLLSLMQLAIEEGKEVHLVNFTSHTTSDSSRRIAGRVYAGCRTVAVREPFSHAYVSAFHPEVQLFPDIVSGLELTDIDTKQRNHVLIGGSSARNIHRSRRSIRCMVAAVAEVCARLDADIILTGWRGLRLGDDFLARVRTRNARYMDLDFRDYYQLCRTGLVNFTGRHHGSVMAFAAGCPQILATSNSCKTDGDAQLYGAVGPFFSYHDIDVDALVETLAVAIENSVDLRLEAEARRAEIRPHAFGCFENIVKRRPDLVDLGLVDIGVTRTAVGL